MITLCTGRCLSDLRELNSRVISPRFSEKAIETEEVTIQSYTPSDPVCGPPPSMREAFGEEICPIGSSLEEAATHS